MPPSLPGSPAALSLAARFAFKPAAGVSSSTPTRTARTSSRGAADGASTSSEVAGNSTDDGTLAAATTGSAAATRSSPRNKRRLSQDAQQGHPASPLSASTTNIKAMNDKQTTTLAASPARSAKKPRVNGVDAARKKEHVDGDVVNAAGRMPAAEAGEEDWEIPDDVMLSALKEDSAVSGVAPVEHVQPTAAGSTSTSANGLKRPGSPPGHAAKWIKVPPTAANGATLARAGPSTAVLAAAAQSNGGSLLSSSSAAQISSNAGPPEASTSAASPSSSTPMSEYGQTLFNSLSTTKKESVKGGEALSTADLLELECRTMHSSWLEPLSKEMRKSHFLDLKRFLWSEGIKNTPEISKNIFPPAAEIYSWSRFTPLDKVRVVILGQDPYHNVGQAHGLAFSVRSNVAVPPSLKNIYKEIKNDYPEFQIPKHGYLGSWAKQGVLLLNTSLSVRAHQANSHSKKGWESLTDAILRTIDGRPGPGVVFLAWGLPAQKRIGSTITDRKKHLVLSSVHPSPLSAARGFFGNNHFKKTNEWLAKTYGSDEAPIDWCTLEPEMKAV